MLKQYNASLVRKLEERNTEVEKALKDLQAAHDKTQESEERFRQLAENIREVFFLIDPAGTQMLYVSPAYEEIWKRTTSSLYENPRSWTEPVHPDDRARVFASLKHLQKTGQSDSEYRIVHPDGTIRWIHARNFPILNDAGELYRVAGVAEDITERKQAGQELRRSEDLKSAILESSLDGLITIDHEGKIVEFNPAAETTFGLAREEALGKVMVDLIVPPRLRDAHRRGFAHYLATGQGPVLGKRIELEAIRADGTEFPIELAITAIRSTSTPMFTGFIRDITARKEADGKIKRLNRVYAVLSGINTLIVRAHDRDELFAGACRIAVEDGNFGIAWIGSFDPATFDVTPVAWAGLEAKEYLGHTKATARADLPQGQGVVGRAIRELKPVFDNDISVDTGVGNVRRAEALRRGYRSLIVLPLIVDGAAVGNLSLFAREPNFFDEEELRLLTELAGDISFALENIGRQQKLDKLARIRAVSSKINAAIMRVRDRQELLDATCTIAVEQAGFPLAWIGMLDPATQDLKPAAMAGTVLEYAKVLGPSIRADIPAGQGTNGRAFREQKPVVDNDMTASPNVGFKRSEALKGGIQAACRCRCWSRERRSACWGSTPRRRTISTTRR